MIKIKIDSTIVSAKVDTDLYDNLFDSLNPTYNIGQGWSVNYVPVEIIQTENLSDKIVLVEIRRIN